MKQKASSEHKNFLSKRFILEMIGLLILILFCINQWPIIYKSLNELRSSDPVYLFSAIMVYWLALPLTAISYQILSKKKINIWTTSLAQLAGSGPGRIIPGGLGRLSFSVLHLRKIGIETSKAIIITVTSGIISVIVTILAIFGLSVTNNNARELIQNYALLSSVVTLSFLAIGFVAVILWLLHAHKTRKSILKINRQWKSEIGFVIKNPEKIFQLVFVALTILFANTLILLFCSYALGINLQFSDSLLALSAGVFVGGFFPTPGGIGGVEAGIVAVLILFGYSASEATSVALLFRAVTYMQPLLPGLFAYIYLREKKLL